MKLRYYHMLAGLLIMAACNKELPEVSTPDFNVALDNVSFQANAPVTFKFTGDPNYISFYSGEPLKEYAYREGRIIDATGAGATMSFSSALNVAALPLGTQGGTPTITFPPQLTVMASTNFSGTYDFASVQTATWTNITSRFNYGTTATFVASKVIDISDLLVAGKPIYIAFKYKTSPQLLNGMARQWLIQSFVIASKKDIGNGIKPNVVDQPAAGFQLIDQNATTTRSRSSIIPTGAARIAFWANLFDVLEPQIDPASEVWAVSKAINTETIDLGPDRSIAVKNYVSSKVYDHVYKYEKPGTYKATFVATNGNVAGSKEVVKEVEVTITP